MKKFYLSALTLFSVCGINAQIIINQANHAPTVGDTYQVYQCDSAINISAAGANTVWSYPSLNIHYSLLTSNTVITNANPSYTNANITVTSVPSGTASPGAAYYTTSANDFKFWGGDLNLGGQNVVLTLTTPAVYMSYPTSIGTNTNSNISGSVVVLGNTGTVTGVSSVTANATGTLVVPNFTLPNTIKILTTIGFNGTVQGFTVAGSQQTYDFYSPSSSKFPILTVVNSTINSLGGTSVQKYAYVQKAFTPVAVKELVSEKEVGLYPNPANTDVNFVSDAGTIEVFDISGKLIESKKTTGNYNMNVSNFSNGVYIFKLTNEKNEIRTGKFTVFH